MLLALGEVASLSCKTGGGDEGRQDAAKPWGNAAISLTSSYVLVDVVLVDHSSWQKQTKYFFFKKN